MQTKQIPQERSSTKALLVSFSRKKGIVELHHLISFHKIMFVSWHIYYRLTTNTPPKTILPKAHLKVYLVKAILLKHVCQQKLQIAALLSHHPIF